MDAHAVDGRSDEALVAFINQGDMGAFEVLYGRHKDWVVAVATRVARDPDLALDVMQETFLYVLRKFPGFRLTCQFRSFLYPAVRNLAIAARDKAMRLQAGSEVDLEQCEARSGAGDGAAGRAQLADALAALPEAQREVLLMRFVDGMSMDEMAGALDIPSGTVKSRLHHALAALRADPRTREFF